MSFTNAMDVGHHLKVKGEKLEAIYQFALCHFCLCQLHMWYVMGMLRSGRGKCKVVYVRHVINQSVGNHL